MHFQVIIEMKKTVVQILIITLFIPNISTGQNCKFLKVIPHESKIGETDLFSLQEVVSNRFREEGYNFDDDFSIANSCTRYKCKIFHTENYGFYVKDTVKLSIYDGNSNILIGEYYGYTKKVEFTFRQGYRKATKEALNKFFLTK